MATVKKQQPRLAFHGDPTFHTGAHLTVRLGEKWLKHFLAGRTDCIVLNGEGKRIGTARIDGVYYLPLNAVKDEWLRFTDQPGLSWRNLLSDLRYRYSCKSVSPSHYASCVWFTYTAD